MRTWTQEQRDAQSKRLRDHHAKRRTGGAGGRLVIARPGRTAKAGPFTLEDLPQLLEAHQLVERMGWEFARVVADRVSPQ